MSVIGENEGGVSIGFGDPSGDTPTNSIIQGSELAAINTPGMTTVFRNSQPPPPPPPPPVTIPSVPLTAGPGIR